MSHHFFSAKIWIVLTGTIVISGSFFLLVYLLFDTTDDLILQSRLPIQEAMEKEANGEEWDNTHDEIKIHEKLKEDFLDEETMHLTEKGNRYFESDVTFPCMIRMIDNNVGVYQIGGSCLKELRQFGEHLTEADKAKLRNGIYIKDEKELIIVMESYHFQ